MSVLAERRIVEFVGAGIQAHETHALGPAMDELAAVDPEITILLDEWARKRVRRQRRRWHWFQRGHDEF